MRNHILLIATGSQGVGKSHLTIKQLLYGCYVAKHKERALIFDTNGNEYAAIEIDGKVHKIQTVSPDEIIRFSNAPKPEVRRISPIHPNGMIMNADEIEALILKVITYLRNSALLIEDTSRIYGDNLPQNIAGLLCNCRHRAVDTILHLQSAGRILPKMRQNCAVVRMHYQFDSIEESKEKLAGDYEIFSISEKIVNKQYLNDNKHFVVYIYRDEKKLRGMFSPKMFTEAAQEYISENPKALSSLLVKRDSGGRKMFDYEKALKQRTAELFKKYYGN